MRMSYACAYDFVEDRVTIDNEYVEVDSGCSVLYTADVLPTWRKSW